MSNLPASAIESALVSGDLNKLNPEQRVSYYNQVCLSLGLNPLTQPFAYITLNGKLTLYARKDAADQLRSIKKISIYKLDCVTTESTYEVTAYGRNAEGREDSDMGIVDIKGLSGEKLANAKLKAVTKAKRRLTLSLSGLGILDETEVDSISDARPVSMPAISSPKQSVDSDESFPPPPEYEGEIAANPEDYIVGIGKNKGRTFRDVGPDGIQRLVTYLKEESEKKGEAISGKSATFMQQADTYLTYIKIKGVIPPDPPPGYENDKID